MKKFFVITSLLFFMALPYFVFAGIYGGKAPDFSLPGVDGKTVSLSDFKGKVVFIDFWASWCPPCKKEFPELNRFLDRQRDPDFVVLAVSVDKLRSHVDEFISGLPEALSSRLHVLLDPDAEAIAKYNAKAMPTSFVIDREGVVRFMHFGFNESDPDAWSQEVSELLGKRASAGGGI